MSKPVLYNYDLDDACYRVRLLAALLGVELEIRSMNVVPGNEHLSAEYRALNPLARLPLVVDDGLRVFGTEAILAHLARSKDPSGAWLPQSGEGFSRVMVWLTFSAADLGVTSRARAKALFETGTDGEALGAEARAALRVMDDQMTHLEFDCDGWFAGKTPTIADVALFPAFALSRDFGIDHDEFPALRRWQRRFRRLPGFITMPGIPDYH